VTEKVERAKRLCALCGPDIGKKMILCESHFLPKAIYRYLNRSKAEDTRLLIRTQEDNNVFSMGKQITQELLCDTCETLMSEEGEDYYSRTMLKIDIKNGLPPPAFRILVETLIVQWNRMAPRMGYHPNVILSIGSNLLRAIESRQIYHFAIGMFWKATSDNWKYYSVMPLEASLIEGMRKFLLGGDFLKDYIVRIVPSFWNEKYGVILPVLLEGKPFFSINQFDFYLEKNERQFNTTVSMNAVPLLYTVDSMRSKLTFQGMSETYKNAKQTKSAIETRLSWLAD
jgi:hypothetical protein